MDGNRAAPPGASARDAPAARLNLDALPEGRLGDQDVRDFPVDLRSVQLLAATMMYRQAGLLQLKQTGCRANPSLAVRALSRAPTSCCSISLACLWMRYTTAISSCLSPALH